MEPVSAQTPQAKGGQFQPTSWSLIARATSAEDPGALSALNRLCSMYWYPVYAYIRREGKQPEEAEDLTQEFFATLLQKRWLQAADRERGRFRSFLLASLRHFLLNEHDRAHRLKRGGGYTFISLESAELQFAQEPMDPRPLDKQFDRQWAVALLDRVVGRLSAEFESTGRSGLFEELKPSLIGESINYAQVAAGLGISEGALRVAVHRFRQRYRELLRSEVAQTVQAESEVDGEVRHLFSVMAE